MNPVGKKVITWAFIALLIWVPIETLMRYAPANLGKSWDETKTWESTKWALAHPTILWGVAGILLLGVGIWAYKKFGGSLGTHPARGGGHPHPQSSGSGSAFLRWTIGIILWCASLYAVMINNTPEAKETHAQIMAWKNRSSTAREIPAPEPPEPPSIRTGTWDIIIPPGEWSEWVAFERGYRTQWDAHGKTVMVQKGRLMTGRQVQASNDPPRPVDPRSTVYYNEGEATRFLNDTSASLTITVKRSQ